MNIINEIQRINERELKDGTRFEASWHQQYRDSAWIFAGGLPYELTEGDIICVFSQFGEIEDMNLVRDEETGKSKGFAYIKYEDWRSTVLAVDNFNGFELLGRLIRVDHVLQYKLPKALREKEEVVDLEDLIEKPFRGQAGHAYEGKELASKYNIHKGVNVFEGVKGKDLKNSQASRRIRQYFHSSSYAEIVSLV